MKKIRILVSAYACEPDCGGEPGVGWNWMNQIATFAEVWVVTRQNNSISIEKKLDENPNNNLHFIYVDLPRWMRFWKKKERGVRTYYYLWQIAAYVKTRRVMKSIQFDLAHHVTFVNDWLPSFLALLPVAFIWGPIGSNSAIPKLFVPSFKRRCLDRLRIGIQTFFRFCDPIFYLTFLKARKIILINEKLARNYPFRKLSSDKLIFLPAIGVEELEDADRTQYRRNEIDPISVISVGRLINIKGFTLCVKSFISTCEELTRISLKIIGDGADRQSLEELVSREAASAKVTFYGKIDRRAVLNEMRASDIFLFPSFEGGGMVVLEAMAAGLPVVCLDYGGPGEMVTSDCGIKIQPISPEQVIKDLAAALSRLAKDRELRDKMGKAAKRRVGELYLWTKKGEQIKQIYLSVV